jgi:hypothetical protein
VITWGSCILALLRFVGALTSYAHDRQLINEGKAEEIAAALADQSAGLRRAMVARAAVHDSLAHDPDRVRDDDGFQRPDK